MVRLFCAFGTSLINCHFLRKLNMLNQQLGQMSVQTGPAQDEAVCLSSFVEHNRPFLQPPVSNRMLYNGKNLKVMIVGGPNERDDFHVQAGEEFFYQITGTMNLDVMQEGKRTRLSIPEGHMFVLPSHVPHSPQRYAHSIGLVVERARNSDELDELRWYWPESNATLYTETFFCTDLGTQIKSVIERFAVSGKSRILTLGTAALTETETESPTSPEPPILTPMPQSFASLISPGGVKSEYPICLVDSEFVVDLYNCCGACTGIRHTPGQEVFLFMAKGTCTIFTEMDPLLGGSSSGGLSAMLKIPPIDLRENNVCLLSAGSFARSVQLIEPESVLISIFTRKVKNK